MIQCVLCYGHSEFTRTCIRSIYENTPEDQINLVVWENRSNDPLREEDIDPHNSILLRLDQNYGCSNALNSLIKDFGAALNQDVMYISNDHYVFPGWIHPLLENPAGFHAVSPMHPFGLPDLHGRLSTFLDFQDQRKREFLDHPESAVKIRAFLREIYGNDLHSFLRERIYPMPEVALTGQFWAGCFFLTKEILGKVGLFRTDRGLACDEDTLWREENIQGRYREGVYSRCYIHHFQSITTNRFHLTLDHEPDAFSRRGSVPAMSGFARSAVSNAVDRMSRLVRKNRRSGMRRSIHPRGETDRL